MAMLDAILSPEWDGRYYSFNAHWAEGEQMASMRDGSGDEWFLSFTPAGAALKGFAHEFPMATRPVWPGVLSDVPGVFGDFLSEPAFSMEEATFCLWRTHSDRRWQIGQLLFLLVPTPTDRQTCCLSWTACQKPISNRQKNIMTWKSVSLLSRMFTRTFR